MLRPGGLPCTEVLPNNLNQHTMACASCPPAHMHYSPADDFCWPEFYCATTTPNVWTLCDLKRGQAHLRLQLIAGPLGHATKVVRWQQMHMRQARRRQLVQVAAPCPA